MSITNDYGFRFTWKIVNFSSNDLKHGEYMSSPLFNAEILRGTKWFIKLYPLGYGGWHNYVACYLCRNSIDDYEGPISVSFLVEISDLNGKIFMKTERNGKFHKGSAEGTYNILSVNELSAIEHSKNNTLVIRFHLFNEEVKNQKVTCNAWTEIHVDECSYKWNVQFPNTTANWSKTLFINYQELTRFEIILLVSDNKVHIKFEKKQEQVASKMTHKCRITALKYEGAEIVFPNNVYLFQPFENNAPQEFEIFIDKHLIADQEYCSYYSFILMCDVSSPTGNIVSYLNGFDYSGTVLEEIVPVTEEPRQTLQQDLRNMFMKAEHCDVQLRLEDKTILAHKCWLAARSPVFSAMFKQDMSESQCGIVDIADVETEVMQSFLEFLYSETLMNTGYEHILKLIIVADRYQVLGLKERCFLILKSCLNVCNACEIISIADLISYEKLKMFVMDFIKQNKNEVFASPGWWDWVEKNSELAIQIWKNSSTN